MDFDPNVAREILAEHVDRISTLPDDIISNNILSLLSTRDSVRTSALSSKWTRLYASVPVLDFEYRRPTANDSAILDSVSKVINIVSRISKFRIQFGNISVNNSNIISWIETTVSHPVQKLDVRVSWAGELPTTNILPTPHSIFTCETLVSLSLELNLVLSVPDLICLPKLKKLWLKNIRFRDEESVTRLFSSCHELESLVVISWKMDIATVFNVSVPSLKILSLNMCQAKLELLINCPNLEELNCECYAARGYTGDVLGSLKKCEIDVGLSEGQFQEGKLIELARQVSKVQFLSLGGDSMQALLIPPCALPIFENLTHLVLELVDYQGWQLLSSILDSSPNLETLVFRKGFLDLFDSPWNPFPPPEHVPVCLNSHLKAITIGRYAGEEDEYKWVEYFLTNGLVLEKMEIFPWLRGDLKREWQFDSDFKRHVAIRTRLLSCQPTSKICQIVLVPSN